MLSTEGGGVSVDCGPSFQCWCLLFEVSYMNQIIFNYLLYWVLSAVLGWLPWVGDGGVFGTPLEFSRALRLVRLPLRQERLGGQWFIEVSEGVALSVGDNMIKSLVYFECAAWRFLKVYIYVGVPVKLLICVLLMMVNRPLFWRHRAFIGPKPDVVGIGQIGKLYLVVCFHVKSWWPWCTMCDSFQLQRLPIAADKSLSCLMCSCVSLFDLDVFVLTLGRLCNLWMHLWIVTKYYYYYLNYLNSVIQNRKHIFVSLKQITCI